MTTVISVENLSKTYRLGQIGTGTFAHDLNLWWARIRGKQNSLLRIDEKDHGNRDGEEIWALRDVSFKVEKGDVLGIIGRNGAGKSTLLKILSRVTAPTSGRIKVKGRIASLLEVGTGFHPDLTGRENIYLNGAILGMSRSEIARKFNEIVGFAEVEKFIDTPVKRYSSGMYVRLAFAVAAHLDPEILIVDEVLAVGDAEFQKKCLGKMSDVAKEGRTVLFVSHNMDSVEKLCDKVFLMDKGMIRNDDTRVRTVIDHYLAAGTNGINGLWQNPGDEFDNEWFRPLNALLCDKHGRVINEPIRSDFDLYLKMEGEVKTLSRDITIGYYCYSDKTAYPAFLSQHNDGHPDSWPQIRLGNNILITKIPTHILNEGSYQIKPYVILRSGMNTKVRYVNPEENKLTLAFEISNVANDSSSWMKRRGIMAPVLTWKNTLP
jgi:lipopolysaccharide transport system ATP-binding protein